MEEDKARWRHYPAYFLFKGFCRCIRLLPESLLWHATGAVSRIVYVADARHRRLALANLDIAFGDGKTKAEKRRIARGAFKSLFLTVVELIRVPLIAENVKEAVLESNIGAIGRALQRGRGVIFLVSHFGNGEIMAHRCVAEGHKLTSVGRPLKNPLVYKEINRLRMINGAVMLEKKWVAKDIIERLRQDWCVAILFDQYAGRYAPFVPFFGRPVSTTPAPALLAMKTGASVVPVFDVREGPGRHRLTTLEPVELADTGDREADVKENCARFNKILEEWIRKYPDHWLWMARRWRRKKGPDEP
jgi:KDO2-lipid IV(A) lauroyltransferase